MKAILILLLSISSIFAFSGIKHLKIQGEDFTIIKESYKIYDDKAWIMKLYYDEENNDLRFLLSLVLSETTGSCSKKAIQKATYKINNTKLTIYHYYTRKGKANDVPYGAKIEVYNIQKGGKLTKISSKVYIESSTKDYEENSGMKYLFQSPKSPKEKALFKEYIKDIEEKYQSTFVYKEEAKALIKEVKEALKKNIWK